MDYCKNLESISIPDAVRSIGNQAFANCKALVHIDFPANLDFLGHHAFDNCGKLKVAEIKGNITAIEEETFNYCSSLQSVQLPNSVIKIGPSAFYHCDNLEKIELGTGLERVNNFAFTCCKNLQHIIFPESLKEIGLKSFLSTGLVSIKLPKSLKKLGEMCFAGCENLTSVDFCGPVKKITRESFSKSAIKKIKLPEGVQAIEMNAFSGVFSTDQNQLRQIYIPRTVSEINDRAFGTNPDLEIYCYKGTYAEEFAINHGYKVNTDLSAISVVFPEEKTGNQKEQQSPSPKKKSTSSKKKSAPKSNKKPEDCPIPKDFKDHTTITDKDFTPKSDLAQSAVCYILQSLSKMDLRFSTLKSDYKLGNELFVDLVNVGSYQNYQETVCRAIDNDPFEKALLMYTIRDFMSTIRHSDRSQHDPITASYCGLFLDMLRFLYTNDRISDPEQLLCGMGTLGLRYRNVVINEITAFSKQQSQSPETRIQAAREWLTKICRQPDIRILCSDSKINPVMFLLLLSEDVLHFQDSDFEWDEDEHKHLIHEIQANEEMLWSFPELFFMWNNMAKQVVEYLNDTENAWTDISKKDRERPRPWETIGAWTPFALFYAATQDQIAVSFTEDGHVYLCFTELLRPFEQNLKSILSNNSFSGGISIDVVSSRRDVIDHKLNWGMAVSDNGFCSGERVLNAARTILADFNKSYDRKIAYAWPSPKNEAQTSIGFFGIGGFMGGGGLKYQSFSSLAYNQDDNEYFDVPSKPTQEKLDRLLENTGSFSEEKRALHYARLFRVSKIVFDPRADHECEIRDGYLKDTWYLRAFRSFIWCLASYLADQGKYFDEVSDDDVQKVLETIKEGTNYTEDSYFPELCSAPESFGVYTNIQIPEARIVSAYISLEESESNTVNCLGKLENLRNEIRLLIPAMDLIYKDLKSKRDHSQPLEGNAAAVLSCWCVIALAAESNVVSATTGRLGMYWDQFTDSDDFSDHRSPSEILSGISVPWFSKTVISVGEIEAANQLMKSINDLQSTLDNASSSISTAAGLTEKITELQHEAERRDEEKEQHIKEIALAACQNNREPAWLYFILRNEWALSLLNCSDDEFCDANQKYFPNTDRNTLLMWRQQAMPWLNDQNTYNNQIRMLYGTDFEQRYIMLVENYLDRINPADPWQHINNAFGWLRNFFTPQEQQLMWNRLCEEINRQKAHMLDQLAALNPDFTSFETAKRYLVMHLEDPGQNLYDRFNPYNYLSEEAFITVALSDQADKKILLNLPSSQAWIWNTTINDIYSVAVQKIQEFRKGEKDGEALIRRLLPQYFKNEEKITSANNNVMDIKAMFSMGKALYDKGDYADYAKALPYLETCAEQGHSEAQFLLGTMYAGGRGVQKSEIKAAKYFQQAADQGHMVAQFDLGNMYADGRSVKQSYSLAIKYLQLSADQGYSKAQYCLGVMYNNGEGVIQSYQKAVKYYKLAADQGFGDAQFNLALMYEEGQGVAQSDSMAVKYYQLAADQGVADAQYNLGIRYVTGDGVPQSDKLAAKYFELAANQGNQTAQYNIGAMYANGQGVTQSVVIAKHYLQMAANQGSTEAAEVLKIL